MILDEGKLPLWNPYHMGGEPLATPPGFHFFVSTLILLTGMPLLIAQLVTAAFFSAFIVFPAYLISKKIWRSHSAGTLAAFFAAVSALSLEMISWGGYTNVISLALIVTLFYLFLKDLDQPSYINLLMGTMLFGSIILTHTFSLFVFFPIIIFYFASLFIGKARKLKEIKLLKPLRFFTISVALGIIVVSPWLLRVLNFYMGVSSEGVLLGGLEENKNLILANRTIIGIILSLVIVLIPTFLMLKASRKRYFDNWSLLLIAWFLVPLIMTQSHIFGVFVDYSRFMYFIDFPGILIISASLLYLFRLISIALRKTQRTKWSRVKKLVPAVFIASLFVFIVLSPWSIFPNEAMERVDFYTTIHGPEATAMEWIQNRIPESSVLVADHLYGWWLSGVGERTTLSAAGLEFLLYLHEIEVAKSAQLLLDTNYYIDNCLIQVREDGVHLSRHNPEFSIEARVGESFSVLNFQDSGLEFWYEIEGDETDDYPIPTLADMRIVQMPILMKDENSASLTTTFEDELFIVNKTLTVQRGVRFAELSYDIEVKDPRTNLYLNYLHIYTKEGYVIKEENLYPKMFGFYDTDQKVCGLVVFKGDLPAEIDQIKLEPLRVDLKYRYSWKRNINMRMLIGVFDAKDLSYPNEVEEMYHELAASPLETVTLDPLFTWNYVEMIEEYDVSYVVNRDKKAQAKFSKDPNLRRLFNNGNVTIFQAVR
ncbi:MAG: hypothetical protein JSW14_04350 [Candidatus Bathyarchaeum sp.]|nr:MAG: hypothetical protein JSW14_04350 [Candidatus Bathyarchaeum sp.]